MAANKHTVSSKHENDEVEGVISNMALYAALSKICTLCARLFSLTDIDVIGLDDLLSDDERCIRDEMLDIMFKNCVQMNCLSRKFVYAESPLTPFRMHFSKYFDEILQLTYRNATQCYAKPTKPHKVADLGFGAAGKPVCIDLTVQTNTAQLEAQGKQRTQKPPVKDSGIGSGCTARAVVPARCSAENQNLDNCQRYCSERLVDAREDCDMDKKNAATKFESTIAAPSTLHPSRSMPATCGLIDVACSSSRFFEEFLRERVIGKGGFGKVWKARNKVDGQFYAVKRIAIPRGRGLGLKNNKAASMRHSPIERILREVKVLSGLHNQHVVGYHAAWIESDALLHCETDSDLNDKFKVNSGTERSSSPVVVDHVKLKTAPAAVPAPKRNAAPAIVLVPLPSRQLLPTVTTTPRRHRSTSRSDAVEAEASRAEFFIRDPGSLSTTTTSLPSPSSSQALSTTSSTSTDAEGDERGYDDDDEGDEGVGAKAADRELIKMKKKLLFDKLAVTAVRHNGAGRKVAPVTVCSGTSEPTGDSVVFAENSPVNAGCAEQQEATARALESLDQSLLTQGNFNCLAPPTNRHCETNAAREKNVKAPVVSELYDDCAQILPFRNDDLHLSEHRIALCIQMELCDASLSQYIWARNFYMQCESDVQITRACQQGLRDPYIPPSVFNAVVNGGHMHLNPNIPSSASRIARGRTVSTRPPQEALAQSSNVVAGASSSPSAAVVPRQNSGIGLNLMHCVDVTCCLKIIRQILLGVEYIHSRGLVHRDLKPSNIFFKFDGGNGHDPRAMIGDFGLARYISAALDTNNDEPQGGVPLSVAQQHFPHQRRLSVGVGTTAYASPEQLSGRSYDSKSDIFSFGLIMFEIIVPFFTTMERNKLLNELRSSRVPPAFKQQYPRLEVLLRSMLNSEPGQRPTASKILQSDVFEDKDYIISNLREKLIGAEMQIEAMEKQQQISDTVLADMTPRWARSNDDKRKMSY